MLAKFLNEHSAFLHERGIKYDYRRTSTARLITLTKLEDIQLGMQMEA